MIAVEKDGQRTLLPFSEIEKMTGAPFIPELQCAAVLSDITKRCAKMQKKGKLTTEQLWLGAYFKNEILTHALPDVTLRWIDSEIGWGVFANRNFKKMEFIAEYSGQLRRRTRDDRKNGYCFEYVVIPGVKTPYLIDAREQGGISRYINHSSAPNLSSALATVDLVSHIVLFTRRPIQKGEQLTYDYGADYWSCRKPPRIFVKEH